MLKNALLSLIIFLPFFSHAQDDDIALIQSMYGMEKRKMVTDYMQLPDVSAAAFWDIYDKYEEERKDLGRKRLLLINEYAENYMNLTNEKADQLAKDVLTNNVQYEKLHQKYYSKFKKATSPLKAAQFLQLETFLQNEIRSAVQEEIPFIGNLGKLRN
jgi:hypothetical protein